jgi:flagellar biosynthesis protein FliP
VTAMADPNELLNALNLKDASPPVQLALALGLSALIPAAVMTLTSFTRVIIVLSFVRQGLATPNLPPNQVLIGLAMFISVAIMQPTLAEIDKTALQPYLDKQIDGPTAVQRAAATHKKFMLRHTRPRDLDLFLELSDSPPLEKVEDVPFFTLVPAFVISELKTAFIMGFCIFLPFLMVDLVVSSSLTAMGMVMMPPVTISAPFKILLFVLADGWHLIAYALAASYNAV